jgi:hypothetical protein
VLDDESSTTIVHVAGPTSSGCTKAETPKADAEIEVYAAQAVVADDVQRIYTKTVLKSVCAVAPGSELQALQFFIQRTTAAILVI